MQFSPIEKRVADFAVAPNLQDYDGFCEQFSWSAIRSELSGLPQGRGLNIAHEALGRHVADGHGDRPALHWIGKDNTHERYSYASLDMATNRFANVLAALGIAKGQRVFSLAGRIPALYIAALGTIKHRAVFCPLFAAFGPDPVRQRMARGSGRVLVTTAQLYERKVAPQRAELPELQFVLIAGIAPGGSVPNGTTGTPKGAVHVHEAVLMHYASAKYALDLHPEDCFWCTADPGWVTGTSYGIVAPLVHGVSMLVDEADFDAERWYELLETEQVSVWYTAPTAIRMLMKGGAAAAGKGRYPRLRFIASVGEPLNPEAVIWGQEAFGMPIHDNWWQTETGGIMIANFPACEVRPGSMGRPLPGVEAAIVEHDKDKVTPISEPGKQGELALRPGWPSMFRGYLHEEDRYKKCFVDGWYLSGDLATRDADGYYWFVGRADDVIKSAGHLIGPFEVESALMAHPAVAEAGVIGKPEPMLGELVKAFVALKPGFEASDKLRLELIGFARKHLGVAVAPKEIEFVAHLPKTRSGKIMRRLLKARELGEEEGDTSTLESQ